MTLLKGYANVMGLLRFHIKGDKATAGHRRNTQADVKRSAQEPVTPPSVNTTLSRFLYVQGPRF